MKPVILFRPGFDSGEEEAIARRYFPVVTYRSEIPPGSLVIPRYSLLPYPLELEKDCLNLGSKLINTTVEHRYIADFSWYEDVKDYTPRTWSEWEMPLCQYPGPFVIKGRTNSRKQRWSREMFCQTKAQAAERASDLANDPLIGPQGVIYREYVPLKAWEADPVNGIPFANEWRFFYYKERRLAFGYYWSNASDYTLERANIGPDGWDFADSMAKIIAQHTNFFVLDVAEKQGGGWILVECNSGEMAGTSCIDPEALYTSLKDALDGSPSDSHDPRVNQRVN